MIAELFGTDGVMVWVCMECGKVTGGAPTGPPPAGVERVEIDPDLVETLPD